MVVLYTLIPMGAAILGGLLASVYIPKPKLINILQHFVAGIVIAAVAVDLLPKILGYDSPFTIGSGFAIGVATMLCTKKLTDNFGIVTGAALDFLIDGILIGIAFLAGRASGILIAFSLSLCAFFLNLAVSSTMTQKQTSISTQLCSIALIAIMLPIGALIGSSVIVLLPQAIMVEVISFGSAALLYLGIEELLAEAHEKHDTAWTSSAFFAGFLVILLFRT